MLLLSDGYLANGSEPWPVPDVTAWLPSTGRLSPTPTPPPAGRRSAVPPVPDRDPLTLARPWAPPGVAGLEHRIGGIEKADGTGNISYDPDNHDRMVRCAQAKVDGIVRVPPTSLVDDPSGRRADQGARARLGIDLRPDRRRRTRVVRKAGRPVATAHLRHLNPFPANTGEVLGRYDRVLVPEMNLGQLALLLRAKLPGRRRRLQPGPRPAVHLGRARRGHRQASRSSPPGRSAAEPPHRP